MQQGGKRADRIERRLEQEIMQLEGHLRFYRELAMRYSETIENMKKELENAIATKTN
jgi:hypothetical protein